MKRTIGGRWGPTWAVEGPSVAIGAKVIHTGPTAPGEVSTRPVLYLINDEPEYDEIHHNHPYINDHFTFITRTTSDLLSKISNSNGYLNSSPWQIVFCTELNWIQLIIMEKWP